MIISRRQFLKTGATVVALGGMVPDMILDIAHARAAENNKSTKERILVVFELNGGNDGINTVIPIKDPAYALARPTIAVPVDKGLELAHGIALHPSMTGLHQLFKDKRLAVIQGAGYPNANRSHFRSMEIWHRGDPSAQVTTGWLGRWWENGVTNCESPVPIIHYDKNRPEMFKSTRAPAMSINAIDDFFPKSGKPESVAVTRLYQPPATRPAGSAPANPNQDLITNTGLDIVKGADTIRQVLKNPRTPKVAYPESKVGKGLSVFAQMIVQNIGTRLYYISLGGFDTHGRQADNHGKLLETVSAGITAFLDDLKAEDREKDVMVMVFSEFGRRVHENGSMGTDHGAASVMLFAGGGVKGDLYGKYPSLTDLSDGDLKFATDFRDCYATVLEKWLGTDPARVLAKHTGRLDFMT